MNSLPKRKHPRLKHYDYSQNGCYFVTVCVSDNSAVLSCVSASNEAEKPVVVLTEYGKAVERQILRVSEVYNTVSVEKYIILPNHIHILFRFDNSCGGIGESRPTEKCPRLSVLIRGFKSMVTKEIGKPIWQNSFYEEIIKNEEHYLQVWQYIDSNAQKWLQTHP